MAVIQERGAVRGLCGGREGKQTEATTAGIVVLSQREQWKAGLRRERRHFILYNRRGGGGCGYRYGLCLCGREAW